MLWEGLDLFRRFKYDEFDQLFKYHKDLRTHTSTDVGMKIAMLFESMFFLNVTKTKNARRSFNSLEDALELKTVSIIDGLYIDVLIYKYLHQNNYAIGNLDEGYKCALLAEKTYEELKQTFARSNRDDYQAKRCIEELSMDVGYAVGCGFLDKGYTRKAMERFQSVEKLCIKFGNLSLLAKIYLCGVVQGLRLKKPNIIREAIEKAEKVISITGETHLDAHIKSAWKLFDLVSLGVTHYMGEELTVYQPEKVISIHTEVQRNVEKGNVDPKFAKKKLYKKQDEQ